jgi:hypothetical protein
MDGWIYQAIELVISHFHLPSLVCCFDLLSYLLLRLVPFRLHSLFNLAYQIGFPNCQHGLCLFFDLKRCK